MASIALILGALLAGTVPLAAQPAAPPPGAPPPAAPAPGATPVRVAFLLGEGSQPFSYLTSDGQPAGFEPALMQSLCAAANLTCTFHPVGTLEDRVAVLTNGTADASIGQLSYTPGRAEVVTFVQPYYYSVGTILLARQGRTRGTSLGSSPTVTAAAGGVWAGLSGQRVCFLRGFYSTAFIVARYNVEPVEVGSVQEGVDEASGNGCQAFAFTSTASQGGVSVGLSPLANVSAIFTTPYGIAVQKGNRALADALTVALVGAMGRGNQSSILELEQKELVQKGVPPNSNLQQVVGAISNFDTTLGQADEVPSNYQSQTLFGTPLAG